jgi:hypothetical protein
LNKRGKGREDESERRDMIARKERREWMRSLKKLGKGKGWEKRR